MTPPFQTILETPRDYDAQTTFDAAASALEERFGIVQLAYAVTYAQSDAQDTPTLLLNYPKHWVDHYVAKEYFAIDPVMERGANSAKAFLWNEIDWSLPCASNLIGEAREHGIGNSGFSVPIQAGAGSSVLVSMASTLNARDWQAFASEHRASLELIAFQLHQVLMMSAGPSLSAHLIGLSVREADVLQWMASGLTNDEVAHRLGITERTVRAHLEAARTKLRATNKTHAIAKAICFGLIENAR